MLDGVLIVRQGTLNFISSFSCKESVAGRPVSGKSILAVNVP